MQHDSDQSPEWEIEFYQKENGRYPTRDFIEIIHAEHKKYVIQYLKRLARYGEKFLCRPYAGYLDNHIWELRPKTERIQYRILGFRDGSKFVICQGFVKKSDSVPPGEITKAIEYRKNYFRKHQGSKK